MSRKRTKSNRNQRTGVLHCGVRVHGVTPHNTRSKFLYMNAFLGASLVMKIGFRELYHSIYEYVTWKTFRVVCGRRT